MKFIILTVLLACLLESSYGQVCNIYCDGRNSDDAVNAREAVSTELFGRQIKLFISDVDNMGFAEISGGQATDQVWIDRSNNGGIAWSGKLGEELIPSGSSSVRTAMFNVDNPSSREIGALRTCGQVGDRDDIACSEWARSTVNAESHVDAAMLALMQLYNPELSVWGWWVGANCLTAVIDYIRYTGKRDYIYVIEEVYERNIDEYFGNFTNDYIDDTLWWGLAWVDAYDVTGDQKYLDAARLTSDYSYDGYVDNVCGGGVWWSIEKSYKNAITNELLLKLVVQLHNRIPGDTKYLEQALELWDWFKGSGMINGESLINDGLNDDCKNNNQATWTYNQGVILGALVELAKATGDNDGHINPARQIADAVLASSSLNPDGILREAGCGNSDCGSDGPTFKGVFVRNLGELDRYLLGRPYRNWLENQANAVWNNNRNALNQFGVHWQDGFDKITPGGQSSGAEAFIAALP